MPNYGALMNQSTTERVTTASLLISLGIIYGDIGTSPLYVLRAVSAGKRIDEVLVFGAISCIFWTLTFQTTLKYVWLTLKADNHGEGGIFALYSLVKRRAGWLLLLAIIGGATLLADGVLTPVISVTSAIEGLDILFHGRQIPTVLLVCIILTILFLFQRFGTVVVGNLFGPIMLIWFLMLAVLGVSSLLSFPRILASLHPGYAWKLLSDYPGGFWLLGAVFLCTTGAEALYSDLGHCGKKNIRISWVFVKTCLMLNYLGQGAWLLNHSTAVEPNPFYSLMPGWFLPAGIVIATIAAVIASQALISGSFTLIGEAIRLGLFPKVQVMYPATVKGQLYIPILNFFLWVGCMLVTIYFKESSKMEGAYGLAIIVTMLATTLLMGYFLSMRRVSHFYVGLFLIVFLTIETGFFIANAQKFLHGGHITFLMAFAGVGIMWIWVESHRIKRKMLEKTSVEPHLSLLQQLSVDHTVPRYASHLVVFTEIKSATKIEKKILHALSHPLPKRADVYWFLNIQITENPYDVEYRVHTLAERKVFKIILYLGFKVQQRINLYQRKIIEELIRADELTQLPIKYDFGQGDPVGDIQFLIVEEVLSPNNDLPITQQLVLSAYFAIKSLTANPEKWFGLDASNTSFQKTPFLLKEANIQMKKKK